MDLRRQETKQIVYAMLTDIRSAWTSEVICTEAYYRTVLNCDELRLRSEIEVRSRGDVTRSTTASACSAAGCDAAPTRGVEMLQLNSSCSSCCSLRELQSGECKFAAEALASVMRQRDADSFVATIQKRLSRSKQHIQAAFETLDHQTPINE